MIRLYTEVFLFTSYNTLIRSKLSNGVEFFCLNLKTADRFLKRNQRGNDNNNNKIVQLR